MNYYERHLGDYAKDTGHLSLSEHGAFTLLMDRYYSTEKPISADIVYRVCRAKSKDEKAAVDYVLTEFFVLEDGEWVNKRCDAEIKKLEKKRDTAKQNGKKGGRPNEEKNEQNQQSDKPIGLVLGSENITQKKALQTPDSRLQTPDSNPREEKEEERAVQERVTPGKKTPVVIGDIPASEKQPAMTSETWAAYANAYHSRYGVDPVRNAQVSSQLKQFCQRIGVSEAPHVAEFFVRHNGSFYVLKGHAVGVMVSDAEKLRTEWATQTQMTATRARQVDEKQTNYDVVAECLRLDQQAGVVRVFGKK